MTAPADTPDGSAPARDLWEDWSVAVVPAGVFVLAFAAALVAEFALLWLAVMVWPVSGLGAVAPLWAPLPLGFLLSLIRPRG